MVLESPECSEERKWLVRRLIELRLRLQEVKEQEKDCPSPNYNEVRVVLGHHFIIQSQPAPTTKYHCDRCCGVIWSVVHSWYQCVGKIVQHMTSVLCCWNVRVVPLCPRGPWEDDEHETDLSSICHRGSQFFKTWSYIYLSLPIPRFQVINEDDLLNFHAIYSH